jgi:RimJ/RimL family protein N-acetyltransferase
MDKTPIHRSLDAIVTVTAATTPTPSAVEVVNWRQALPSLNGALVTLRELRPDDAPALLAAVATEEVSRFISPPPSTIESFERFIGWTHAERMGARSVCFAAVPQGEESAVGLFQMRSLEPEFGVCEWGFALAVEYWGSGIFTEGAELFVDFAFDVVGAHRLEARAAVRNARGNAALRKIGAVHEGILRRSFLKNGEYLDQALWTILREEWMESKAVWGAHDVVH